MISVNTLLTIIKPRLPNLIQKRVLPSQKATNSFYITAMPKGQKTPDKNQKQMIRLCEEETILLYFLHLILVNLDQKFLVDVPREHILIKSCATAILITQDYDRAIKLHH